MAPKSLKAGLDLFLRKATYKGLPNDRSLLERDRAQEKETQKAIDAWQKEMESAGGALNLARLLASGQSLEELKASWNRRREASDAFHRSMEKVPQIIPVPLMIWPDLVAREIPECRDVIVRECQQRICVDQPVPITIDLGWFNGDGRFAWARQHDRFTLNDGVYGSDYWNLSGHHRTGTTHDGEVNFRAGATLVEEALVRQIGVRFIQYGNGGNGAYVTGEDGPLPGQDWGKADMFVSFQVLSRTPTGPWTAHLPFSSVETQYVDEENRWSRPPSGPAVYPPTRSVDIYQRFPAGTEFVLEIQLRYWIRGWGYNGYGGVSYSLQVSPYMNLESCSWQWPT